MYSCEKTGKSTATARERELYRYYQPLELLPDPNQDEAARTKRASTDPCLTAFAQLGALRLNAKRGIIALSAGDTQYIIAESGQALSLQQDDDERDQLWHGVGLMNPDKDGMGPTMAKLFSDPNDCPPYILISDTTKDDRFKDRKVVLSGPKIRALACVPLRTPLHNVVIGTYVVVDDKVRERPQECELQFIQDMAVTVMDYLEAGRINKQQYRAERMVKAIGLFIEGKSTLREWWLERGHKFQQATVKKRHRNAAQLEHLADLEFGVQESSDYFSHNGLHNLPGYSQRSVPQSPSSSSFSQFGERGDGRPPLPSRETILSGTTDSSERGEGRPPVPSRDTLLSGSTETSATLVSRAWQQRNSSVTTFDDHETLTDPTPDPEKSVSFDLPTSAPPEMHKDPQEGILSSDMKAVFGRAANLIREAIGVEGVIYYDASIGSFGGSAEKAVMDEKGPGAFHVDKGVTSSEDDLARKSADETDIAENGHAAPQNSELTEKYCNVLGFSTRRRSSLRGHPVMPERASFPEAVLRKLLKRYPHGKVFNFDEDGSFSSSESDYLPALTLKDAQPIPDSEKHISAEKSRRNRISREAEAAAILKALPGARSVFFFPLWDQNRERWFAGSLVWSNLPTRTLCPIEDITYLAAFGNSTMAEIARLSAQVLSKMKTDFISSISHELRSPLHGVLASVEFLQETQMTEVQADMVSNIHASGKVLLDTINHVLDFSKVNRRSKEKKRLPKKKKKNSRRESVDNGEAEEKADICILSEEVIESIYAGQKISKKAFSPGHHRPPSIGWKESPVTVIVDIDWRPNWTFEIDAGAWRRILMNLFSNAMKYTSNGFVKISLELENDVSSRRGKPRSNLTLRVNDSGKGISQEFLNHQLYKPFTQEDSLAMGAGLGMSIVKAIVQDLGGRIDVTSEPGTGTEAVVRIPLTASLKPAKTDGPNYSAEVKNKVKGLKFSLECFDRYPDITETPDGILSAESEAAMLLKASFQSTLVEWFGMTGVTPEECGADVVVIMESGLGEKTVEDILHAHHTHEPAKPDKSVAIILTSTYHKGPKVDAHDFFHIFYLQQPYGPHKLAKTLHNAFCDDSISFTILDSTAQPPGVTRQISDLASPLSDPLSESIPTPGSATQDFAPISTLKDTLFPETLLSPPKPPVADPLPPPPNTKTHAANGATEPVPAPAEGNTEENPEEKQGLRVLLVEDNEINLKLLIATMRKLKLDHATATNGLEAFNSYKERDGKFDVVFMDISMPIMSGIESTRHIRRFEKENGLEPVALIALTGAANPNTRQEAFSSGVDLFLTKPVPMKALRGMLEDLGREGRAAFAG